MTAETQAPNAFAPCFTSQQVTSRDPVLMRAIHRLRYQVYCEECQFLDAQHYPNQTERDTFDDHSAHFGALNAAGELVGYVRLVHPDAAKQLPLQQHGVQFTAHAVLPPPKTTGEISRLMVRKDYRRRRGDLLAGVNTPALQEDSAPERRNPSPQIMLSLYRSLYRYSLAAGVQYWYAAMERPLARALSHMGFPFEAVGAQIDYYGLVAPYLANLRELEARLQDKNPTLLHWMRPDVDAAAAPLAGQSANPLPKPLG